MDLNSATGARSESILSYRGHVDTRKIQRVYTDPPYRIRNCKARLAAKQHLLLQGQILRIGSQGGIPLH